MYTEYFRSPEKTKNFDLHYLAFAVSGSVMENVNYMGEFELEHGGKGDNTFVEQAYIDWWFRPNVALKVGAMLTPFFREGPVERFERRAAAVTRCATEHRVVFSLTTTPDRIAGIIPTLSSLLDQTCGPRIPQLQNTSTS